ncbi:armadillo-type protein [Mycena olivaceomarginata]|nr:armadillo-type protein [Mycena olivaceomarginata]
MGRLLAFSYDTGARKRPVLRCVGNIVTGDDLQTEVLIASGVFSPPTRYFRLLKTAVIDANVIPPLVNVLQNPDFKTKKEACWVISTRLLGGLQEPAQIRYLVAQGCIKPLCDLLTMVDNKVIQVALDGLDNILKIGEMDKVAAGPGAVNQYAVCIEEAGGMINIHNLEQHENLDIYKRAFNMMDKYFLDEGDLDVVISAPAVDSTGSFAFQANADAPEGGFSSDSEKRKESPGIPTARQSTAVAALLGDPYAMVHKFYE